MTPPSGDSTALAERIRAEQIDVFDEEYEMVLNDEGDNHLAQVLDDMSEEGQNQETLARRHYFKELFRLQGELVKLQDWVVHRVVMLRVRGA